MIPKIVAITEGKNWLLKLGNGIYLSVKISDKSLLAGYKTCLYATESYIYDLKSEWLVFLKPTVFEALCENIKLFDGEVELLDDLFKRFSVFVFMYKARAYYIPFFQDS